MATKPENKSKIPLKVAKKDDNITNIIQKYKDGASTKKTTGPKKSTSPSVSVHPKNCQPHSGLIFNPTVTKSTMAVKPFNIEVNPPKIRRSISEYDFKFVRPKAGTIQPQQKDKNTREKDRNTVGRNCAKAAKPETIPNLKKIDKKPSKEFQAPPKPPISSGRLSKHFPVDKNSSKAVASKPLRRSNTMHAFDSVQPKAGTIQPQQKDKNTKEKDRNTVSQNCAKAAKPETISNLKKIDKKPTKEFQAPPISSGRLSKHFPVDKNSSKAVASKPLRRSNAMHAFDSVPNLKKGKVVQTNKSPLLKQVQENALLEKVKSPVTPENSKLEMPLSENFRDVLFTPKKDIPHGGLVLNKNAARMSNMKLKAFVNVK